MLITVSTAISTASFRHNNLDEKRIRVGVHLSMFRQAMICLPRWSQFYISYYYCKILAKFLMVFER
jgi:hypothetical protein